MNKFIRFYSFDYHKMENEKDKLIIVDQSSLSFTYANLGSMKTMMTLSKED